MVRCTHNLRHLGDLHIVTAILKVDDVSIGVSPAIRIVRAPDPNTRCVKVDQSVDVHGNNLVVLNVKTGLFVVLINDAIITACGEHNFISAFGTYNCVVSTATNKCIIASVPSDQKIFSLVCKVDKRICSGCYDNLFDIHEMCVRNRRIVFSQLNNIPVILAGIHTTIDEIAVVHIPEYVASFTTVDCVVRLTTIDGIVTGVSNNIQRFRLGREVILRTTSIGDLDILNIHQLRVRQVGHRNRSAKAHGVGA